MAGLILPPFGLSAQMENHLILKKQGFKNKLHFFTGDPITVIRAGNSFPEEYFIQGIGADYLVISGLEVPISSISCVVHYRTGFNFAGSGKALQIAAPGYLVIGAINTLFQHRNTGGKFIDLIPTPTNLIVAGSLLTAGLILPRFQVRKYPIGKKFTLKVVQSDPAWNR
jgi:hypothetical protein